MAAKCCHSANPSPVETAKTDVSCASLIIGRTPRRLAVAMRTIIPSSRIETFFSRLIR
jgi:hypothetical protein